MANNQSIADELQKLSDLKEKGVITEEEFNEQKARLLQRSREQSAAKPITTVPETGGTKSSNEKPTVIITQTKAPGSSGCLGCASGIVMAITIIIVLLAIGGYFWFSSHKSNNEASDNGATTEQSVTPKSPETSPPSDENMATPPPEPEQAPPQTTPDAQPSEPDSTNQQASPNRSSQRLAAIGQTMRSAGATLGACISAASSDPQYAPLSEHVPLTSNQWSASQLSDDTLATDDENELIRSLHQRSVGCDNSYLNEILPVMPTLVPIWQSAMAAKENAIEELVQKKISWGQYARTQKDTNDQLQQRVTAESLRTENEFKQRDFSENSPQPQTLSSSTTNESSIAESSQNGVCTLESQPSFDCSKAISLAARTICSSPELRQVDCNLSHAFGVAASQADATGFTDRLRTEERTWIKQRNQACLTRADLDYCLAEWIQRRTEELNQRNAAADSQSHNAQ